MKRLFIGIALVLLLVVGSYAVFAQQQAPPQGQTGQGQMGRGMMGRGMMMQQGPGGMGCPMCGMVAGGMMQKTMVPTEDGGVIMALGDKLTKYDSNLNKVKEVTLDIDINQMHQKMQQMMQNCPMMRQMQQQQQAGAGGGQEQQ